MSFFINSFALEQYNKKVSDNKIVKDIIYIKIKDKKIILLFASYIGINFTNIVFDDFYRFFIRIIDMSYKELIVKFGQSKLNEKVLYLTEEFEKGSFYLRNMCINDKSKQGENIPIIEKIVHIFSLLIYGANNDSIYQECREISSFLLLETNYNVTSELLFQYMACFFLIRVLNLLRKRNTTPSISDIEHIFMYKIYFRSKLATFQRLLKLK